jgi:hypothetical protein
VDFIAHAPEDVAALLTALRATRAALKQFLEADDAASPVEKYNRKMAAHAEAAAVLAQMRDE